MMNGKNMSSEAADFMAAQDEAAEATAPRDKTVLDRDSLYTLTVETVACGENQFGKWVGLNLVDGTTAYFGGYEASDIERVLSAENIYEDYDGVPFDIKVLRTLKASQRHEGRTYAKVYAEVLY